MGYDIKVGKDITVRPLNYPRGRKLMRNFGEDDSLGNIRKMRKWNSSVLTNKNGNTARLAAELLKGKEYEMLHLTDCKLRVRAEFCG